MRGVGATLGLTGLLLWPAWAAAQPSGTIRGRVTVQPVPPPTSLKVTTDQAVCGLSVPDESLLVDPAGGLAHAVITVRGVRAPAPETPAVVTNRQCRFVPHVLVARPGSTLRLTSDDKTLHTTHAYSGDGQSLFNIALPLPGLTITRPLPRAGLIRLGCDAHPWMRGFVVVTDELAAVSGPDGRFVLEGVPAGPQELRLWHELLGEARQSAIVPPGGAVEVTFALNRP
jgi:plastocyanin